MDDSGSGETQPRIEWVAAALSNHSHLVAQLGLASTSSDGEVVAALVERRGITARSELRGACAFAMREASSGDLLVTRDHLGVMPAYWAIGGDGRIHIADTLAELAAVPGVDTTPDPIFATAVDLRVPGLATTNTPMQGIHRVPPGSTVRIGEAGATVEQWWDPTAVPRVRISVDDAARQLHELLVQVVDDAVDACWRQVGNAVAAHLSGGMDSTTVAILAQRALLRRGGGLTCVLSWSPPPDADVSEQTGGVDVAYDERELVRDLAQQLSTEAVFATPTLGEADWLEALSPEALPRMALDRESHVLPMAHRAGVRRILSGWGGDEFVSFNGRMTNRAIVRGVRIGAIRDAYRDLRRRRRSPLAAAYSLARAGMPATWKPPERPARKLARDDRARAAARDYPSLVADYFSVQRDLAIAPSPRAVQVSLLRLGHVTRRIESWHEAGRRFGVEYSYPLLDVRLVEWALSMPPEVFRCGDHSRQVFRLALEGIVPDEIRRTTKDDPVLLAMVRSARTPTGLQGAPGS